MFDDLVGAYGSRFLLAAGGVGIAPLLLIVVLWFMRSRAPSPSCAVAATASRGCRSSMRRLSMRVGASFSSGGRRSSI